MTMSVSGIYVLIDPDCWDSATTTLGQMTGIDLHQRDAGSGRLVLTQEAESTGAQIAGLEQIQQVRGVRLAGPVYHYVEEEEAC